MNRVYFILVVSCLAWKARGQTFTSVNTGITGTIFSASAWADYDQVCDRHCNKGCDQAKVVVCMKSTSAPLFIPNLVIPNGDGKNDYFEISGLPSGAHLTICNRWGDVVFTSNDYKNDWSGEGLNNDVYYYQLLNKNDGERYKGWVQLLK